MAGWQDAPLADAQPPGNRPAGSWRDAPLDPSSLTWGEWARNLVTGEYTTEFPNAEEFASAFANRGGQTLEQINRGEEGANLSGINVSAITSDPAAQLDILRRNVPGLEDRKDAYGNVMVRAPRLGVTEWTYLNRPGASAQDASEFGTQLVATLPFGGLFGRGTTIPRRILFGAAGGAGASVTTDLLAGAAGSEQGVDPYRAVVSGGVGGVLGPLTPRTQVRPPPAPTAGQEAVQAAERLNTGVLENTGTRVDVPRAMATENRALQELGGASRRLPFGTPLEGAAERLTTGLGEAAERTAAGYGANAGPLHAGDVARQGMLDWIRGGSQAVDRRLYGHIDDLLTAANGHNITVPLAETRVAVLSLLHEMGMSTAQAPAGVLGRVWEAVNRQNGLNWRGAQILRTELSDLLSGSVLPEAGTSMPALRRLREALTIDMGRILDTAAGPQAVRAWHRADRVHSIIARQRADLARIIGERGDVAPEAVFERLLAMARTGGRADMQRLMQARRAMGDAAWDEVTSSAIGRMGRTPQGEFSLARFLTEYGKLTQNGRQQLFGSTGRDQLWRALDDIETVAHRFQDTMTRYANPSGTGRAVTTMAGIAGAVTAPMQTLAAVVTGYGLAQALARPVTARAVARYLRAQSQRASRPGQASAVLAEQAERQLHAALQAEGIRTGGQQ
jgi:hypothetical protein